MWRLQVRRTMILGRTAARVSPPSLHLPLLRTCSDYTNMLLHTCIHTRTLSRACSLSLSPSHIHACGSTGACVQVSRRWGRLALLRSWRVWSGCVHSRRDRKLRELDEMLAGGGGVSWEQESLLAERQRSATLSVDLAQREQSLIEAQQALALLRGENSQLQARHSQLQARVATESGLRFSNDRFVQAYNSNLSKLWAAVGRPLNDTHPEVGEAALASKTHPNTTGITPAPHRVAPMQVSDELLPAGGPASRRLSMSPQPSGVGNGHVRESWSVSPAPISLSQMLPSPTSPRCNGAEACPGGTAALLSQLRDTLGSARRIAAQQGGAASVGGGAFSGKAPGGSGLGRRVSGGTHGRSVPPRSSIAQRKLARETLRHWRLRFREARRARALVTRAARLLRRRYVAGCSGIVWPSDKRMFSSRPACGCVCVSDCMLTRVHAARIGICPIFSCGNAAQRGARRTSGSTISELLHSRQCHGVSVYTTQATRLCRYPHLLGS